MHGNLLQIQSYLFTMPSIRVYTSRLLPAIYLVLAVIHFELNKSPVVDGFILQELPIYRTERRFHSSDSSPQEWEGKDSRVGAAEEQLGRNARAFHFPRWSRLHNFWEVRNEVNQFNRRNYGAPAHKLSFRWPTFPRINLPTLSSQWSQKEADRHEHKRRQTIPAISLTSARDFASHADMFHCVYFPTSLIFGHSLCCSSPLVYPYTPLDGEGVKWSLSMGSKADPVAHKHTSRDG